MSLWGGNKKESHQKKLKIKKKKKPIKTIKKPKKKTPTFKGMRDGNWVWVVRNKKKVCCGGCNHSGQPLAKTKGVHREVESERRWRQSSGLTYRNHV